MSTFDRHARQYDLDLEKGTRLAGEPKEYFARARLRLARDEFARLGFAPRRIVEFGCGIGTNIGVAREFWPDAELTGLDISEESLKVAREEFDRLGVRFLTPEAYRRSNPGPADWVFCTGVLHHIPPSEHDAAIGFVRDLLAPGGRFTPFDNNPFNPGARMVMARIPFDRDAVMVSPYALARTLRRLGFEDVFVRFLLIFPRPLAFLRPLEPSLERFPLGAQYGVFARRPA